MNNTTDNTHIKQLIPLSSPSLVQHELPIADQTIKHIQATRVRTENILKGTDDGLVVIVGPCSIHDPAAAIEYATRLQPYIEKLSDQLCIIMRVYFEKPRTTVGWKGLINDPELNNTFNINKGLHQARQLLLDINQLGVAAATEFLDTIIPQYISDLISWAAIGARTTESQIHRELASGLSMPVGFKNSTYGDTGIAVDAVYAASRAHHFLGVTKEGLAAIVSTTGNTCHVILRGGKNGPNYDSDTVNRVAQQLTYKALTPRLMIDCSHGNSGKDHTKQRGVVQNISEQLQAGQQGIGGVMLESHLVPGNQPLGDRDALTYGQSITDACIGWEETVELLEQLHDATKQRRQHHDNG